MKIKETMRHIGVSYRSEMLKITLLNLVGFALTCLLFFALKQTIFAILVVIGLSILNYFVLTSYQDKKVALQKERENELINLISYFEIYIQNQHNVYQSFNLLLPYCSPWMKGMIDNLLREIDQDKSVQPFINFASNFQQLAASSLMLSIYQMIDQGGNATQFAQFNLIFDELAKNRNIEMMEQKEKKLANMATYPLIGAGLITIALTISILSILGDVISVI